MFTMLPNASVACGNVATVLSSLRQACRHFLVVVVVIVDGMFYEKIPRRRVCGFLELRFLAVA